MNKNAETKSTKYSPPRKLDELIDWYEKNNPEAGQQIAVHVQRGTILKWGVKPIKRGGPLHYRGRELIPRLNTDSKT